MPNCTPPPLPRWGRKQAALFCKKARKKLSIPRGRSRRDRDSPGIKKFFWFWRPDHGAAQPRSLHRAASKGFKKRTAFLLLLALPAQARTDLITLGSAPQPPVGYTHLPYANPDAPQGGAITLPGEGGFDSLNPFILRGTAPDTILQIWQPLFKLSDSDSVTEYAELAQSVQVAGNQVTFTLNPAARFSDGTQVTAADVVWTYNTLIAQGAPFYAGEYAEVAGAAAPNPQTVVFTLKPGAGPDTVFNLAGLYVLPAHFWAHRDFAAPLRDPPIGSGPYVVSHVDWGSSITYTHVPQFWAQNLPADKGFNNFQSVTELFLADKPAEIAALRAGQIDALVENSATAWARAYDFPAVRNGQIKRALVPETLPAGITGLVFNTRRPDLADARVRHALTLAFDFPWTNRVFLGGDAIRETSYFSSSAMSSAGLPGPAERALLAPFAAQIPPAVFTTPFALPTTDGSGYDLPNLRAALALLGQAGWHIRNFTLVNAAGRPMRLTILLQSEADARILLPYAHNLGLLGMSVSLRLLDPASYQARLENFDFDMTPASFPVSDDPGSEQLAYWGCAAAQTPGSYNLAGVCTPATEAMIKAELAAAAPAQKQTAIHALDRLLLNGWYVLPYYYWNTERLAWWQTKVANPGIPLQLGHDFSLWWAK